MKKGVRLRIAQHAACCLRASAAFLRDTNQVCAMTIAYKSKA
jgi:hypothetical protein